MEWVIRWWRYGGLQQCETDCNPAACDHGSLGDTLTILDRGGRHSAEVRSVVAGYRCDQRETRMSLTPRNSTNGSG